MADLDGALPIRTELPGDVAAKIVDATDPSRGLKVNADGSIDTQIRPLSSDTDSIQVQTGDNALAINEDGSINAVVAATDLDIRDLDADQDSVSAHLKDADGNPFSAENPLPVSIEESKGDEVADFQTTAAVAVGSPANHDYMVSASKTLVGESVFASGSGRIKVEVKIEGDPDVFATKFVGFNSVANPNVDIPLRKILKQIAAKKVRITITNLDKQAQDVYSTITGVER